MGNGNRMLRAIWTTALAATALTILATARAAEVPHTIFVNGRIITVSYTHLTLPTILRV